MTARIAKKTITKLFIVFISLILINSIYSFFRSSEAEPILNTKTLSTDITPTDVIPADLLLAEDLAVKNDPKTLRVLTWSGADNYLGRSGVPRDLEVQYLERFAKQQKLTFKKIEVEKFSDLIPYLLAGKGDVIAANLSVTKLRKKKIKFTLPIFKTREYLLMGKNNKSLKTGKDLNGRTIYVQKGKSYELTAQGLQKVYPKLEIKYFDETLSFDKTYNRLASGEFDLTLQDKNLINTALSYRDDLKISLQSSAVRDIAWGVSPKNKQLLKDLNTFVAKEKLDKSLQKKKQGVSQWQHIKNTKKIRFVLRNNLSSYYIWRGQLLGFHYELAKRFAEEYNLRYEIIVAPNNASLLDYIIADKADVALGFLTPTQERVDKGLIFSRPYHYASELIVANASHPSISDISELHDSSFYLRRSSAYWQSALELKKTVNTIKLHKVSEKEETEHIIDSVGSGKYSLTIADGHILDLEMTFRDDIQSLMSLGEPKAQGWAMKKGNDVLLKNVNHFIKKYYKGLFYNVIYNKYFRNERRIEKQYKDYVNQNETGVLSPYDDTVKYYAKKYHFDWRLLIAQMHQESHFNPHAVSIAGAQGLFQVMPRTAKELGIKDMHNPKQGIRAGVAYMDWVRERMKKSEVNEDQLIWFTLASYNAGAGHVRDAIRLAKQKGWKGDIWFDNVERAMQLLSHPKYAAKARYGYVRGREPVEYIRAIKLRYETYVNIENAISQIEN